MLRVILVAVVAGSLLVPTGSGGAASSATVTISCAQVWTSFNVQLLGNRDSAGDNYHLGDLESLGAPGNRALIVVWSIGGTMRGGLNVYEWASSARAWPSRACKVVKTTLAAPSLAGLGPRTLVRDGWSTGRRFTCIDSGRLLITTTQRSGSTKMVVRMQRRAKVIAVGEVRDSGGWIRGSRGCDEGER